MSTCSIVGSCGAGGLVSLALIACFNPHGNDLSTTDESSGKSSTDAGTAAPSSSGAVTTEATPTTEATTGAASSTGLASTEPTSATTSTTDGGCSVCGEDKPYCYLDVCTSCADFMETHTCADEDADAPLCDPGSGHCVACLTVDDCTDPLAPVCDGGACRGCTEHAECADTACELDVGSCFPAEMTTSLYVEPDAVGCAVNDCMEGAPCCSTAQALEPVPPTPYIVVHVKPGPGSAPDVGVLHFTDPGKTVAILGEGKPNFGAKTMGPPVIWLDDVTETSKLFIAGIVIAGANGGAAISCTGAAVLWIDDSAINLTSWMAGDGYGLFASKCALTARRGFLVGNEVGVRISLGGRLALINTIVGGSTVTGVLIEDDAVVTARYATIVSGANTNVIACSDSPTVEIHNSAVLVDTLPDMASVTCPNAVFDHSAVTLDSLVPTGVGNVQLTTMTDVKAPFVSFDTADWRAMGDGAKLKDVARWQTGDPPNDFNGTPRTTIVGALDVAGADRN